MSKGYQYLKWNEISGNGLTSAVNSAAVATAGLAEANRGIVGLADKFTKIGQDISKTATERRDKALNEYSNNLFNEALQGSMNADGTVNSGQLMQNLKTLRERDKANGEFWNDQEVGNKIGALTLKYNDTFADNAENVRNNKMNQNLEQLRINIANAEMTNKLAQDIRIKKDNYLSDWSALVTEAEALDITVDYNFVNKINKLVSIGDELFKGTDKDGKPIYLTATDRGLSNNIGRIQNELSIAEKDIVDYMQTIRKEVEKKKAEQASTNANNLKR